MELTMGNTLLPTPHPTCGEEISSVYISAKRKKANILVLKKNLVNKCILCNGQHSA